MKDFQSRVNELAAQLERFACSAYYQRGDQLKLLLDLKSYEMLEVLAPIRTAMTEPPRPVQLWGFNIQIVPPGMPPTMVRLRQPITAYVIGTPMVEVIDVRMIAGVFEEEPCQEPRREL